MMEARPQSLTAMGNLPGIGERKLEAYGTDFLQVIHNA
jgi:ATP-dependent DNA helicase RecQ